MPSSDGGGKNVAFSSCYSHLFLYLFCNHVNWSQSADRMRVQLKVNFSDMRLMTGTLTGKIHICFGCGNSGIKCDRGDGP